MSDGTIDHQQPHDINILPHFHSRDEMDKLFPVLHAPPPMENAEDWQPGEIDGQDAAGTECGYFACVPGRVRGGNSVGMLEDRMDGRSSARGGAAGRRPPGST